MALIGRNISSVYLSEAPTKRVQGELGPFTRKIMGNLFRVGLVPFLLVGISAPFLFPYIFGADWVRAGIMVSWMAPYMLVQFIASPVSTILYVTENQKLAFAIQAFGFVLLLGAVVLGANMMNEYTFEFFAVASAVYYTVYLSIIFNLSGKKESPCVE